MLKLGAEGQKHRADQRDRDAESLGGRERDELDGHSMNLPVRGQIICLNGRSPIRITGDPVLHSPAQAVTTPANGIKTPAHGVKNGDKSGVKNGVQEHR